MCDKLMRGRLCLLGRLSLFIALMPMLLHAERKLSGDELQQILQAAASAHRGDDAVVQQLAGIRLTERLSVAGVGRLIALSPGAKSTQALRAIAGQAAFLELPAGDLPAKPAPGIAEQKAMLARTIDYVAHTMPTLPNLMAMRVTEQFVDSRQAEGEDALEARGSLFLLRVGQAPIAFRDGRETDDPAAARLASADKKGGRAAESQNPVSGMTSWGEFGPVLGVVLVDAAKGRLGWSRWELEDGKQVAVFQFSIDRSVSHYRLNYCCEMAEGTVDYGVMRDSTAKRSEISFTAGYHGRMEIDPATGAVLRITIDADLRASDPIERASMMVEYGPVKIGDRTRLCPTESVSLSVAQAQVASHGTVASISRVLLNSVQFTDYRRFGSEARIVAEAEGAAAPAGDGLPKPELSKSDGGSGAGAGGTGGTGSSAAAVTDAGGSAAPAGNASLPVAAAGSVAAPVPSASAAGAAAAPPALAGGSGSDETVVVRDVAEMPGMGAGNQAPGAGTAAQPEKGNFTLHVETRLVDVGLIANDRHGRPVTDLKPEEVAIYDNGRPEKLAEFHHAGVGGAAAGAQEAVAEAGKPDADSEGIYTNARAGGGEGLEAAGQAPSDLTILLLDEGHLPFNQLNRARGEVMEYLKGLPKGSRLALYAIGGRGFYAVQDVTDDVALVEARLKAWTPNAADVAQAQEEEKRNRQQFDYVRKQSDMQYVNGNHMDQPDQATDIAPDPQLRKLGDDAVGQALTWLTAVARHFASVRGHKSLVWISGDNALVDWRDQAVRQDRSVEDRIVALRHTAEALNGAQMALYVVDASDVGAGAATVDPGLANPDVELAPGSSDNSGHRDRSTTAGRMNAALLNDTRGIQGPVRELAQATGGAAFNKGSDLTGTLKRIESDASALYALGFYPDTAPDGKFHTLELRAPKRSDLRLRYRTGYLYDMDAGTVKERLQKAVWTPQDLSGIRLRAEVVPADGSVHGDGLVRLRIGFSGLDLERHGDLWRDDLYIFLAERDDVAQKAQVTGDTLRLSLKQETYATGMPAGIPYQHEVVIRGGGKDGATTHSVRLIVVDGNSGKMGSVTVPARAFQGRE